MFESGQWVRWALFVAIVFLGGSILRGEEPAAGEKPYTVASYYFPNYHPGDPRNEKLKGKGWSEWELVKNARPRFPGHIQPNEPLWGYADESDPNVMAQKIDAAADHGIDAFIFDWYWYDDGPFLDAGLDKGFLNAPNNQRLRFALMWANHDWIDIQPRTLKHPPALLYPGRIRPETFDTMTDYIIEHYFKHPSYWKIQGRPYFSVYELYRLVESFGGVGPTRQALDRFREKVRAAGLPGVHLNAVAWGVQILPGETVVKNPAELIDYLGFDSVTSYVWIHHVPLIDFPQDRYDRVKLAYFDYLRNASGQYKVPYYPNITMGWDSSPRADQTDPFENRGYPFMTTLGGNTPEAFRQALIEMKQYLDTRPAGQRVLTINCWNEWTEGSYLEPDQRSGMKYLQAVKEVFGPGEEGNQP